jgi:peptide/nickel transport system permease protein
LIFKKYFRVIVKPIALTAMFFILVAWLYFAFAPILRESFSSRIRSPEAISEELARLSSLGTFLTGVLRGDFGYSYRSGNEISYELGGRLQNTALLIGMGIMFSVVTSIIVVLIASVWKPTTRKPQVFGHSLRSYLFGLTPFLGMILFLVFCYNLRLFPSGGMYPWAVQPANLFEQISGRLPYLVMPSLSLALILLARSIVVVWSGGSPIFSESWWKRFLFAFTTIDFVFIICAVVLVEQVFIWPGLGKWLWDSIDFMDYNAMIAAFIALLALAVVFGYISTVLDFLQRFSGLQENLERKATQESTPPGEQKVSEARKVKGMLLGLWRRKSLIAGTVIVVIFILVGVFVPLLTPYDPVNGYYVAGDYAQPSWLPRLTGQNYSLNMNPIDDPGFTQGSASIGKWNITAPPQITYGCEALEGRPKNLSGSGPGCLILLFSRNPQGTAFGQTSFKMDYTFNYDQSSPPIRFIGELAWRANIFSAGSTYRISASIRTPISSYTLYTSPMSSQDTGDSWLAPQPPIDSYEPSLRQSLGRQLGILFVDPARRIFNMTGTYTYSVEIVFENTYSSTTTLSIRIYLDDVNFRTLGDAFGLLGTDQMGRDLWSQLLYGIRTSLIVALPLAALATLIGFSFGFLSGYFQGWADNLIMTFFDVIYFIPVLPFLILSVAFFSPGGLHPGLWLSLPLFSAAATGAFRNTFLMRPQSQKLKGDSPKGIFFSMAKALLAGFSLSMISLILLLPVIDFFDLFDPSVMSWGRMLNAALSYQGVERWWWTLPPLIFIVLLALGFFLLGSALDERFK